jgi:hypothetical protein
MLWISAMEENVSSISVKALGSSGFLGKLGCFPGSQGSPRSMGTANAKGKRRREWIAFMFAMENWLLNNGDIDKCFLGTTFKDSLFIVHMLVAVLYDGISCDLISLRYIPVT